MRPLVGALQHAQRAGGTGHIPKPTLRVHKLTQDGEFKITKIPGASNPANNGTKLLDGRWVQKVLEKGHCYIREGWPEIALRAEVQELTRQHLEVFHLDAGIDLETHRNQTRLKTGEQIDARVEFLVLNKHNMTDKMKGNSCEGRTMRSGDRGGTEPAEGPNGVTRTVNRRAPLPRPKTQLKRHMLTTVTRTTFKTDLRSSRCGSLSLISFNEVPVKPHYSAGTS